MTCDCIELKTHIQTYVALNIMKAAQSDIDDHIRMMMGTYDWLEFQGVRVLEE